MKPLGHLAASVTTSYQPRSSKFETHLVKIEIIDEAKGNKRNQKKFYWQMLSQKIFTLAIDILLGVVWGCDL